MGDKAKTKMKEGMTIGRALYEAARDGRDDEVDALLKQGAPVDYTYVEIIVNNDETSSVCAACLTMMLHLERRTMMDCIHACTTYALVPLR